ncbi:hypothetical protein C7380_11347 [Oceanotoga teriensis]|jgi:SPX domain protein involved in polyphosphate accumulation|uniref:Flagellar protein FliT n=1 Tax=Oceanotoga teriensis TaxID=515440 RepID=A0AA45C5W0_9BACT|nr:hypothetical protein [Oceanotoga teriensis]PWJ90059.1 hypothetical protein C7380_11347 [Oceanotoga teriensis]
MNDLNELINNLETIETNLNILIQEEKFEEFNNLLDERLQEIKKIEKFSDEKVKIIIKKIIENDKNRNEKINEKINTLKNNQKNIQIGKKAIQKGYYGVQEGLIRKKIDRSG